MLQDLEDLASSCIPQSETKAEQKRLQNLKLDLIFNVGTGIGPNVTKDRERSTTEETSDRHDKSFNLV